MIAKLFLRACNAVLNLVVVLSLIVSGAYAVYALWDNNQVLSAAENVQADLMKLKPSFPPTSEEPVDYAEAFAELLAINPDVCGWISMDNTEIEYPVLQGTNNLTYINKDVYGNFALAGSIYLDSRNNREFNDCYSLLYGHHMADSRMFGDLDLYKKEKFFYNNTTGTLFLPDRVYNLKIYACLLVSASDDWIFEPEQWNGAMNKALDYVEQNALYLHEGTMQLVRDTENSQTLALSTCSSEFTDARTIVLALMVPEREVE